MHRSNHACGHFLDANIHLRLCSRATRIVSRAENAPVGGHAIRCLAPVIPPDGGGKDLAGSPRFEGPRGLPEVLKVVEGARPPRAPAPSSRVGGGHDALALEIRGRPQRLARLAGVD